MAVLRNVLTQLRSLQSVHEVIQLNSTLIVSLLPAVNSSDRTFLMSDESTGQCRYGAEVEPPYENRNWSRP
jgi:hypothetical protein